MGISRRMVAAMAATTLLVAAAKPAGAATARAKVHRISIQVDGNEPALMTLVLNNTENLFQHYASLRERVDIRIVTFGPGLHLLRDDTSPVKDRLASMKNKFKGLSFAACANTRENMEKAEGKPVPITSLAEIVSSGVVELVTLQEQGWSYLRP